MIRLIYAELKKIVLNKKLMIGIFISLMLTISVISFAFADAMKYDNYNGIQKPIGGSQNISGSNQYDSLVNNAKTTIDNIESLVDGYKDLSKYNNALNTIEEMYEGLVNDYNAKINTILKYPEMEDLFAIYQNHNSSNAQKEIIFNKNSETYLKFKEFAETVSEIEEMRSEIKYLSTFFIYPNNNYYNGSQESFFSYYEMIGFHRMPTLLKYIDDYETATAEQKDEILLIVYNEFVNLDSNYRVYFNNRQLFDQQALNTFKNQSKNIISRSLTKEKYENIVNVLIVGESSVKARINKVVSDYAYIKTQTSFNEEEMKYLGLQNQRISALGRMAENYISNSVTIDTLEFYKDLDLKNYYSLKSFNVYRGNEFLAAVPYILENGLFPTSGNDLRVENHNRVSGAYSIMGLFSYNDMNENSTSTYFDAIFAFLSVVIIIICVVIGGGSIAGEQKNGTVKMLIIRPYKRWKILTAKILATLIMSLAMIIFSAIVILLFSVIFFDLTASTSNIFGVFNARRPYIITPTAQILLKLLFMFITIIVYTIIATFMSAVFKSKTAAVVLILLFSIMGSLISMLFPDSLFMQLMIFNNVDLFNYFGYNGATLTNGFTFSLLVCLGYSIVFGALTYLFFNRRDLN